ncbi:MAG: hypothetical protein LBK99_06410 [Opitutaceae bacterium]|jgi:hypothetical protein|nr:hypothetical protein [Opitutaceae bacterium]
MPSIGKNSGQLWFLGLLKAALSVDLDGERLAPEAYRLDTPRLTIGRGDRIPERFALKIRVRIRPNSASDVSVGLRRYTPTVYEKDVKSYA